MKPRICASKYCRNKSFHRKFCSSCRCRNSRKNNPVMYCYSTLKANAKRRRIPFTITYEEFTQFCYKTDYLRGKGKKSDSYSIDRVHNGLGYTMDNIQVMSLSENARKGAKVLLYDWQTKSAIVSQVVEMGGGAMILFRLCS